MLMKSYIIAMKVISYIQLSRRIGQDVVNFYKDNVARQRFGLSTSFHSILSLHIFCHLNINARD